MLTKAIEIALKAHDGQFDKGRHPYILHPLRVMLSFDNEVEQICAVLHDVLEDSPITISELRMVGLSETILEALDCLTKRQDEEKDYDKFIDRLLLNELACRIKLADLEDNMDISRICEPSAKDQERYLKYKAAYAKIKTHLGPH